MTPLVRATPFHSRAAAANRLNAWSNRNGWTLAVHYGDPAGEALAARLRGAIADISWRWRVAIEGRRAEEFLSRLLTRNPQGLSPGQAFKALWLTDRGGVRGAGVLARRGRESFLLVSASPDSDWIRRGATLFDVQVREIGSAEGGLAVLGPYARRALGSAGLDPSIDPLAFRKCFWRGLDVTLSRFGEHDGYEIWCDADDAPIVWSRILHAGEECGMEPAGLAAMDLLDLEAGIARPGRDYEPARDGFAADPLPAALGLGSLIDEDHTAFNGRAAFLAAPRVLQKVGIEFDDDVPRPRTPLLAANRPVGTTLSSARSAALGRAIALATVETSIADPGTQLTASGSIGRIVPLPFLPMRDPVGA